ncbi:jerky-like protein [Trichonephila clavipes]|nr:jerky-like protein [Trichonephila clavipes]
MLFLIVHSTYGFHTEGPISGPMLCVKALELNEKLGLSYDFKASISCLKDIKSRHEIRKLQNEGQSLSDNTNSAHKFKETFLQHVEEDYSRDNAYNVDETGVNGKALPRKSLA